jgi:HEAT repeat protein
LTWSSSPSSVESPAISGAALISTVNASLAEDNSLRRSRELKAVEQAADPQAYVEALRACLAEANPRIRARAVAELGNVDRASIATPAAIAMLLGDPDRNVQHAAQAALFAMGAEVVPHVLPLLLADPAPETRLRAIRVLRHRCGELPDVEGALRQVAFADRSAAVREQAILGLLSHRHATLHEVVNWLRDGNSSIADGSIRSLQHFGPAARIALPELIICLDHPRNSELSSLLTALRALSTEALPAFPALLHLLLESPVEYDYADILETMADIGVEPRTLAPLIARTLRDGNRRSNGRAAALLAAVDPLAATRAALELADGLSDRKIEKVSATLAALRGLGPASAPAVPQLTDWLRKGHSVIQEQSAATLAAIGPDAALAVPRILALLQAHDRRSTMTATLIDALGGIGPSAKEAELELMEFIAPGRTGRTQATLLFNVRITALWAAARIGVRHPDFAPQVRLALESEYAQLRIAALRATGFGGQFDPELLPLLKEALEDADSYIRLAAAQALLAVADPSPEPLEVLAELLQSANAEIRALAALELGQAGPTAAFALPALYDALGVEENFDVLNYQQRSNIQAQLSPRFVPGYNRSTLTVVASVERAIRQIAADDETDSRQP